jgi:hypothetical protein
MPSPYYFKLGWDREKLAEYILSRFSFVAKPSTVSDDLGSDLFCTLFRLENREGRDYPLPICSFAIQIKSDAAPFDFSSNINYIETLEIPFFWGVVNEDTKSLSLYSGENLPQFFSHVGPVESLRIKPIERIRMNVPYDPMQARKLKYTVLFPSVLTMAVDSSRKDLDACVEELQKICSFIHGNISTRKTEEYIFSQYNQQSVAIIAGSGSAKQYRTNFMKRLAENFYNLSWIYDNCPEDQKDTVRKMIVDEFQVYQDTYLKLQQLFQDIYPFPSKIYEECRKKFGLNDV